MTDHIRTLIFDQSSCRAHLVHLTKTWQKVIHNNNYPTPVQRVLGELVAVSVMLSASLKFDGSLIIQIQGDGPIRLLVAECNNQLGLRATVKMAENYYIPDHAGFKELLNLTGKGICAIILDPRTRLPGQAPYQGIVPLTGNSLAESIEAYMLNSEQIETRLVLNANSNTAAGLMIQKMPSHGGTVSANGIDEDGWQRLIALISTIQITEHLNISTDELAKRLFWKEEPTTLAKRETFFECSCSRVKVERMLINLGPKEINEAFSENPVLEILCDFCNANYSFTQEECSKLFKINSEGDDSSTQTLH
jgi:molecular chaperone Hsp33